VGTSVVELASYLSGPYAAMLLADLGAEVIKVEEIQAGDPFRGWDEHGYGSTFCAVNRNKRSIALNLKAEAGRKILLQLTERADVLIENLRPEAVERLGLDYETIRKRNPRLVYSSISGFGEEGPYRDWPGYDTVGQAMGGLLSLLTDRDDPTPTGISLSDHITGIFASYGILAALLARGRTCKGQRVGTSLLQATASFVQEAAARCFATGHAPERSTRVGAAQVYAFIAGDGLPFVVHLSSPPKFWEGLTAAIGRTHWRDDPRFCDRRARIQQYDTLKELLGEVFCQAARETWLVRLREHGVPCAPLRCVDEVFDDPQVQAMGMPIELEHPRMGKVRLSGSAVSMSETPTEYRHAPPLLGEHTRDILGELGYDAGDIARLEHDAIVRVSA
jgi:formyl-CoA transferase